jgi:hypothetical protein
MVTHMWLHRRLTLRAALAGMLLSDYLLGEICELAERPTLDELRARLRRRLHALTTSAATNAKRDEISL